MANISEEMPKKVRHLNRKLKEVIRKQNAMENVAISIKNWPPSGGQWIIGEKNSVIILE
jgi:hypothetical protein